MKMNIALRLAKHLEKFGLEILHTRKVPVDTKVLGLSLKEMSPLSSKFLLNKQ